MAIVLTGKCREPHCKYNDFESGTRDTGLDSI